MMEETLDYFLVKPDDMISLYEPAIILKMLEDRNIISIGNHIVCTPIGDISIYALEVDAARNLDEQYNVKVVDEAGHLMRKRPYQKRVAT